MNLPFFGDCYPLNEQLEFEISVLKGGGVVIERCFLIMNPNDLKGAYYVEGNA